MSISFDEIPSTRVPGIYAEIDNSMAVTSLVGKESVILVIGQALSSSFATNLATYSITSADQAISLFGAGSECARMVKAIKEVNTYNTLKVIPIKTTSGTNAVYTLTATLSNVGSGALYLYIAGERLAIDVDSDTTASSLHSAISTAVNEEEDLPLSASLDDDGNVVLTAKAKGEVGNDIDISFNYYDGEEFPDNLSIAVSTTTQGASNPSIEDVIVAMGDEYYTDIVCPYTDASNMALITEEMTRRFNAMLQLEGTVYAGLKGTHSEILTKASGKNSPHLVFIECYKTPDSPEIRAAKLCGISAYQYQIDPARQTRTLILTSAKPSLAPLMRDERELLLKGGVATTTVSYGGEVLIERVVTSYLKNYYGIDDVSYLDLETLKTLIYLRYSYVARFALKYPRHKLADDGYPVKEGQAIVTPSVAKAEAVALANDWYEKGLIDNIDQFTSDIVSERNSSDTERLDQLLKPDIINNLRVVAGKISFIL